MLVLSRVTHDELRRERVDLSGLARDVLFALRREAPERTLAWEVTAGLVATGDPRLLASVLENLLGNAWKYTSATASPRIEFGAREEGGETVYFVRDNGIGFDMGDAGRLFRPFSRLHPDGKFAGTGVGLATVQHIVQRHGGRVWAEGAPGKGATFFFTLA
jgi:signal transduction histidine kinase